MLKRYRSQSYHLFQSKSLSTVAQFVILIPPRGEQCTQQDCLYGSMHEWFEHELEHHRSQWLWTSDCAEVFHSGQDLDKHLGRIHPDKYPETVCSAAVKACARPFPQ